jgi:ABC-type amino acid transport substrate-binding protein
MKRIPSVAALFGLLAMLSAEARAGDVLSVCLDQAAPPFSFKAGARTGGFDLALAQAIADRLGRGLSVQWFETEDQPEKGKDTKTAVAALLADRRCDLAGAFPLLTESLAGVPDLEARLPRYQGRSIADRRRAVVLGALLGSTPYIYSAPAVVLAPGFAGKTVASLADLDGLRIGVEQSSFPDLILTVYQNGRLRARLVHIVPGRGLLERLEAGEYDAVLVDVHRFDGYRNERPNTALRLSGFLHPIGFNLGFVGLAREPELMRSVDAVIGELQQSGALEAMARKAGLTYLPPREPAVRTGPTLTDLVKG